MLSTVPGLEVVAEASTGDEAVMATVELSPQVVMLDVEMPGPGAAAVIRQIQRRAPGTAVIVLSMHDDAEVVHDLLECGAAAYLSKNSLHIELVAAVRSVVQQSDSVLLAVSRKTVEGLERRRRAGSPSPLTGREFDVLRLTASAFSNAQIASRLYITEATVKRHLTNIYAKLGAVSRVDAVRKAIAARLVSFADE